MSTDYFQDWLDDPASYQDHRSKYIKAGNIPVPYGEWYGSDVASDEFSDWVIEQIRDRYEP